MTEYLTGLPASLGYRVLISEAPTLRWAVLSHNGTDLSSSTSPPGTSDEELVRPMLELLAGHAAEQVYDPDLLPVEHGAYAEGFAAALGVGS